MQENNALNSMKMHLIHKLKGSMSKSNVNMKHVFMESIQHISSAIKSDPFQIMFRFLSLVFIREICSLLMKYHRSVNKHRKERKELYYI